MAHDGQELQVPPLIVVDSGDANSGVVNAAESPAAGNGSNNGEHLVDDEEFENMRLAIGTLGKSMLEISLSDHLTGTRHIDIRVRQKNRPPSGAGVVAPVAPGPAVGPSNNEAPPPPDRVPPPDIAAAAQTNRRLKITVAGDEPEPKPDADAQYLDQMRGWLMTVVTLFVGIAFQAAIQPPQWVVELQKNKFAPLEHNTSGPAAAPSPDAAHQRATNHWFGEDDRAILYLSCNGAAFATAMSLLLVLVLVRGTSTARLVMSIVRVAMPNLFLMVGLTFVVAMSTTWLMTVVFFFFFVAIAAVLVTILLGKLGGCAVWLRSKLTRR